MKKINELREEEKQRKVNELISDKSILETRINELKSIVDSFKTSNKKQTDEIKKLNKQIDFILGVSSSDVEDKKWILSPHKPHIREACAIALFSDFHAEEKVTKSSTNGLNEYNLDIAIQRAKSFSERFVKLTEKERKDIAIKKAIIGFLGDNITGYIHEEYLKNNFLSPTEAILFVLDVLYNMIKFISDNGKFDEITIICKFGNHSRNTLKKTYATGYKDNYEWMMYKILESKMKDFTNVKFIIEEGIYTYTEIFGKVIRWGHGDDFNYRGGVGGIEIPLKTWLYKMNKQKPSDMTYLGHWHDYIISRDCVINPSVIGLNARAISLGFSNSELLQHFELLDSQKGFTIKAPIWLQ